MRQKSNSTPPLRMTWGRAAPVLIVCAVFDLLRLMFEWFWFFGPALAAVYCTATVNGILTKWTVGLLGFKTAALACGSGAVVAGVVGAAPIETMGIVMAMAVGLAGWGTVTLILVITNPQIWKSNAWSVVWSMFGLGISELPILGSIPMLTITHVRLYAGQIKQDKAALRQYQKEQEQVVAAARTAQQQRVLAQMQAQAEAEAQEIPEALEPAT